MILMFIQNSMLNFNKVLPPPAFITIKFVIIYNTMAFDYIGFALLPVAGLNFFTLFEMNLR